MIRLFFCFILFCAVHRLDAQITLHGTVANLPGGTPRQLAIEYWNADHWQQAITVPLASDNSFHQVLTAPTPGQYRLRMWSQAKVWNDFIIADSSMADTALVFALDFTRMDGNPAQTTGSAANALYFDLMTAYQQQALPDAPASASVEFNRRCLNLISRYRNSLVGDIAGLLYEPRKEAYAGKAAIEKMTANEFVKAHTLEKIPFEHDHILYHNAFIKHLNRYFDYFDRDEAGGKAYIDGIMARRNGNEAVDGFLFRFLLDKMMDSKNDPALTYLLNWYAPDCPDENPQPNSVQNLLAALKVCAPGNVAPDLDLPNPDGQMIKLGATCAQHKLTLLLFWRTTCSHCQEFEPKLEEIYQKYHPLGVEVYALSTDKTEQEWRDYLQKHPTTWVNVFIPKAQRNDINRHFPAPSTPTLMTLDKDRRVVSRVLSRGNLEAYLDGELAKRK